jgi:F-type H+-transporting ATPase subunit b
MARWLLIVGLFAAGIAAPLARAADHAADGLEGSVEHGAAAKPDLPLKFQGDLALWSAVTFLFFLFALSKLAWRPLIDGMNAREAKIRQEIADAEANRVKSETLFREYEAKLAKSQEEVKEILAEARRDAEHAKQDIITTAEKESAAMRERAVSEIDRARDHALGELFDFVSKNVMQATEQVVGRSLTGADQERLVKEALASLDLRKN